MNIARLSAVALMLATVAACGGTTTPTQIGDDSPPPPPPPPPPPDATFVELENSADDLDTKYSTVAFSNEALIPLSGTANYEGPFIMDFGNAFDSDENEAAGVGELNFDFSRGNALTGTVTDIKREDGSDISGTLTFSNSEIDRGSGTFSSNSSQGTVQADLTGILQTQENDVITVAADIEGDFRGPNREGLVGDIGGQAIVEGSSYSLSGEFFTE